MFTLLTIIYLSFISLGLPDGLLGAAWPSMYPELGVSLSAAGMVSLIIALGTVISSLLSDRITLKLGAGKVTALSVGTTALALFGFSCSHSLIALCLWAIPYGLGAGSVDAALNNYVALHYESRHMSWLHCMWGLGASAGPYIMRFALTRDLGWNNGYRIVAVLQILLTAILVFSLPRWKQRKAESNSGAPVKAKSLPEILKIAGVPQVLLCFFCYCALESTAGLWASSYLSLQRGLSPENAAGFAALFYVGITLGRAISGFVTMKLSDVQMIRLGFGILLLGILLLFLPFGFTALLGFVFIGLGCAPIYPCIIHSTPAHFGEENSQAIIGVQMASAYMGTLTMPPLFGLLAKAVTPGLLPVYLTVILLLMVLMHEWLVKKTA